MIADNHRHSTSNYPGGGTRTAQATRGPDNLIRRSARHGKSGLSGDCEIDDDGEMTGTEVGGEAIVDNCYAGTYQHMVDQQAHEGYP